MKLFSGSKLVASCYLLSVYIAVFAVHLPCTRQVMGEVDVRIFIYMNLFSATNTSSLELRRRKTCLRGASQLKLLFAWTIEYVMLSQFITHAHSMGELVPER